MDTISIVKVSNPFFYQEKNEPMFSLSKAERKQHKEKTKFERMEMRRLVLEKKRLEEEELIREEEERLRLEEEKRQFDLISEFKCTICNRKWDKVDYWKYKKHIDNLHKEGDFTFNNSKLTKCNRILEPIAIKPKQITVNYIDRVNVVRDRYIITLCFYEMIPDIQEKDKKVLIVLFKELDRKLTVNQPIQFINIDYDIVSILKKKNHKSRLLLNVIKKFNIKCIEYPTLPTHNCIEIHSNNYFDIYNPTVQERQFAEELSLKFNTEIMTFDEMLVEHNQVQIELDDVSTRLTNILNKTVETWLTSREELSVKIIVRNMRSFLRKRNYKRINELLRSNQLF